jgi:hypothetical protein
MSFASVRPRVAEMRYQLLGRSVHPELFQIYKTHQVRRENYCVQLSITADGHYITWRSGKNVLTEVATSATQLLPSGDRLLEMPLRDQRQDCISGPEYSYRYHFQMERISADMFWSIQQQLGQVASNHELIQVFNSSGRVSVGGLSFIHVESRLRVLKVQAIHTFPDDYVLVKTESCFACAGAQI